MRPEKVWLLAMIHNPIESFLEQCIYPVVIAAFLVLVYVGLPCNVIWV